MSEQMKGRIHHYYQLCFKLVSPMLIGCGKSENTDNDVLLGSDNKPYIPATSIAGVLRRFVDDSAADEIFGYIGFNDSETKEDDPNEGQNKDSNSRKQTSLESPVILSDAATNNDTYVTERDNVALDEYKVAKYNRFEGGYAGAKFNYEVVQPGAVFCAIAETTANHPDIPVKFEALLAKASADGLSFGAKSTRGLGAVGLTVFKKSFDLDKALNDWLDFNPFEKNAFEGENPIALESEEVGSKLRMDISLEQVGGLSIRYYTGEIGDENEAKIKHSPLLVRAEAEEGEELSKEYLSDPNTPSDCSLPVIPGTSWAGTFRHRFAELVNDEKLVNDVFGFVDNANKKGEALPPIKSKISFSETVIHKGIPKVLTRIAVDRFSGAVKDRALLTEQSVFYGKGKLTIRIDKSVCKDMKGRTALNTLCAVITDLNNGYLAVGGETAIGRGLFRIKDMKIDGKEVSPVCFGKMQEVLKCLNYIS